MKRTFSLLQTLYNLKNVHRVGINLFAGVSPEDTDNIAVHNFLVSQIALIVGDLARASHLKFNMEILLKLSLYHDWGEAVLGDYPDKAPSYQSYFEENIRSITQKAEKKARQTMIQNLNFDYESLFEKEEYEVERDLLNIADELAMLFEVLNLKFKKYQLEWFDYLWANQLDRLKINIQKYPFLQDLITELDAEYHKDKQSVNPFLCKKEFQKKK